MLIAVVVVAVAVVVVMVVIVEVVLVVAVVVVLVVVVIVVVIRVAVVVIIVVVRPRNPAAQNEDEATPAKKGPKTTTRDHVFPIEKIALPNPILGNTRRATKEKAQKWHRAHARAQLSPKMAPRTRESTTFAIIASPDPAPGQNLVRDL